MKIESYDLYHIGIKLSQFVNLFILKEKLIDKLKENNYEIIKKEEFVLPIQIIGKKDNIIVEINWPSSALNAKGNSPDYVIKIAKELIEIMKELGFDNNQYYDFYEIITNTLVKIKNEPMEVFTKLLDTELPKPNKFLDNLNCIAIRLESGILDKQNEFFDILLEMSSDRPKECIFFRSIYRTKDWNKIIDMHNNFDKNINKILISLGE